MKKFLIAPQREPVADTTLFVAEANSAEEALRKYQIKVIAVSEGFREWVVDLSPIHSFAEQFYLTTQQERDRFRNNATTHAEPEVFESRVRKFFTERPHLGGKYMEYVKLRDETLIGSELLEFIA